MHKIVVPALAAVALAALSTPASAETLSIEIEHTDLNLASKAGLAALERRIERAVDRICSTDSRPLYRWRAQERCRTQVLAAVNEQVVRLVRNAPAVALNR